MWEFPHNKSEVIRLTHAVAGMVVVGQRLVLRPLGRDPEADTCSSCYSQSVRLVGLQLPERKLGLITAHLHREDSIHCGKIKTVD